MHIPKKLLNLIWVLPILFVFSTPKAYAADITGDFTDGNFLTCVSTALGTPGTVDSVAAAALTTLNCILTDITSIAGAENLTSLQNLDLNYNPVTNLNPLSGLTNLLNVKINNVAGLISSLAPLAASTGLTSIEATGNPDITDISVLADLTSLTKVTLGVTGIDDADLADLAGLTGLTYLELSGDGLTDISDLSGMTSMENLILSNNNLDDSDISILSGMTSMEILSIDSNSNITNLSPLSGMTGLIRLFAGFNNINDISDLSGITSMESLILNNNDIDDISDLSLLTNITWLRLNNNNITDISALSGMTMMGGELNLSYNTITDISALSGMTGLQYAFLNNNTISDLSPLADMDNLVQLYLNDNNISDLSPIASDNTNLVDFASGLSTLYITDNPGLDNANAAASLAEVAILEGAGATVTDNIMIDIAADFTDANFLDCVSTELGTPGVVGSLAAAALTGLDCSFKSIASIAGAENLTNIQYLSLWNNNITSISALSGLTNIQSLYLNNNTISDLSPLADMDNLVVLYLNDNNISDLSPIASDNTNLADFASGLILDISNNAGLNDANYTASMAEVAILEGAGATITHNIGTCGDGILNTDEGELCDDGNTTPGDGCDATCQPETAPGCSITYDELLGWGYTDIYCADDCNTFGYAGGYLSDASHCLCVGQTVTECDALCVDIVTEWGVTNPICLFMDGGGGACGALGEGEICISGEVDGGVALTAGSDITLSVDPANQSSGEDTDDTVTGSGTPNTLTVWNNNIEGFDVTVALVGDDTNGGGTANTLGIATTADFLNGTDGTIKFKSTENAGADLGTLDGGTGVDTFALYTTDEIVYTNDNSADGICAAGTITVDHELKANVEVVPGSYTGTATYTIAVHV
jgi:cysteine-rich repeat protein